MGLICSIVAATLLAGQIEVEPRSLQSKLIELRTDLPEADAKRTLAELDRVVEHWAKYWGRPSNGVIPVFVVADVARFPETLLPADAKTSIINRAGTTLTEQKSLDGKVIETKSIVYATADGRTPQHEATHAYCWQTFGRVGPKWYAEGMAEVGANLQADGSSKCPAWMSKYLAGDAEVTPKQIIADDLGDRVPWQLYSHRWALCQMLIDDPRYAERFQQFGRDVLSGDEVDFAMRFPELDLQLALDYSEFLAQFKPAKRPQSPVSKRPDTN